MKYKARLTILILMPLIALAVPLWLWMRPSDSPVLLQRAVPTETPVRGALTVAVDSSLLNIIGVQKEAFELHYPLAKITLETADSGNTVLRLLRGDTSAALIEGELSASEDSLFATMKYPPQRQPVARNALVVIVNSDNPLSSISMEALRGIYAGTVTEWQGISGFSGDVVPGIDGSNFRLRVSLSGLLFAEGGRLKASAFRDSDALLRRVAEDSRAIAVLTLPDYAALLRRGSENGRLKVLPVVPDGSKEPVGAVPESLYRESYPLVMNIYYLHNRYDPLATGFGAWLSKEGQKLFERGDMAPYRQLVRTIILK